MVRFFVEIKFYSFAIFLSNQLWILIFLNEMSTRPRNLLDDLRFSLEMLVKAILKNSKSLENQKAELGNFLKKHSISVEIRNLYTDKILEFYTAYQNNNVKHNKNYNEIEVDFIFEQTVVLMRLLIKLDNKKKTT